MRRKRLRHCDIAMHAIAQVVFVDTSCCNAMQIAIESVVCRASRASSSTNAECPGVQSYDLCHREPLVSACLRMPITFVSEQSPPSFAAGLCSPSVDVDGVQPGYRRGWLVRQVRFGARRRARACAGSRDCQGQGPVLPGGLGILAAREPAGRHPEGANSSAAAQSCGLADSCLS